MRVFILCTGRSGSTTFINACKHIDNYTSGHESLAREMGEKRYDYPDNHIEADNRLSWHLGHLHKRYKDDAFYIHLKRNKEAVAQSFLKRFYLPGSIIDSFCEGIRMKSSHNLSPDVQLQLCHDYIDTVNANIEHFLSSKSHVMTLNLEELREKFPAFWQRIGAEGNLKEALNEFNERHNSSSKRKLNYPSRLKSIITREWRHIKTCIRR